MELIFLFFIFKKNLNYRKIIGFIFSQPSKKDMIVKRQIKEIREDLNLQGASMSLPLLHLFIYGWIIDFVQSWRRIKYLFIVTKRCHKY